jgi:hypothetical protein
MSEGKIILLTDVYETKRRKEEELRFYNEQLEKLKTKMFFIQKDIEITTLCIELIEKEKVVEIKRAIKDERDISR